VREVVCGAQGGGAWLNARCGKITASRMGDILAVRKDGKEAAARVHYRNQIISERITGVLTEHYVNGAMQDGLDREPVARALYEVETNQFVDRIGMVLHPEWDFASASPDGLIDHDGMVQIKCPTLPTHERWVEEDVVPEKYIPQMVWEMVCAKRKWSDFCSWHPESETPLFIKRLHWSEPQATSLSLAVYSFNQEIEEAIAASKK
jgi:exodeoxyribonuclease (lambda-induced)